MPQVQNRSSSGQCRVAAPLSILDAVSTKDTDYLQKVAAEVNKRHFNGEVTITTRWGIPSASEQAEPESDFSNWNTQEREQLVRAIGLFNKRKFNETKAELIPLLAKGQREVSQLYLRVLIHLRDDSWQALAKTINRASTDTLFVAPGSTEQRGDSGAVILVHPSLSDSAGMGAPKYVVGYVMFHEMLHEWMGTSPDNPHPIEFRAIDKTFPDRAKAIVWLQSNNFTTIEDPVQ